MSEAQARKPRLGFLGVGWIGRHRMQKLIESGVAEAAAIADVSEECLSEAHALAPEARVCRDLDGLLALDLDGIVIATPSAQHAEQSIRALEAGKAVFCQKPLGRTAAENRRVVAAAREANRLLGVDFSYRYVEGVQRMRETVAAGEIGQIYAARLVFHNAYGPDKDWFYQRHLAGGGCVMDLGIHLVDLGLWMQDFPLIEQVSGRCFAQGAPLVADSDHVEDYAVARLDLAGGGTIELACSWNLDAGRDAVIEASFYGSEGALELKNVDGSFFDFEAFRYRGTSAERLVEPPDDWGGRALVAWAQQLANDRRFSPAVTEVVAVAEAIDEIYRHGTAPALAPARAAGA